MKKTTLFTLFVFFGFLACKAEQKKKVTKQSSISKLATKKTSASKSGSKVDVIRSYETIRKALANDDLGKTQQGAKEFSKELGDVAGYKKSLLKISKAKDISAARVAFGELSKQVLEYLQANPKKKVGVTAYQCPMAKGYKKWIQADKTMANPYMGKKMLLCGGKTELKP